MTFAQQVVWTLLETEEPTEQPIERVCASCQKEHGLSAQGNQSHGFCRRHSLDYLQELVRLAREEHSSQGYINSIYQEIERVQSAPEEQFAPDLSAHR